jgi:hypothetical protein
MRATVTMGALDEVDGVAVPARLKGDQPEEMQSVGVRRFRSEDFPVDLGCLGQAARLVMLQSEG